MTTNTLTVKRILPYIRSCGYKGQSLMEDYTYCDKNGQHQVGAVGFYGTVHDSATACIAVIENASADEKDVLSYRSLGCPAVLACGGEFLQFWHYSGDGVVPKKKIKADKLDEFFTKYRDKFSPTRIYRAKTIGRVKKSYQLGFVDVGLMPAIEHEEGEYLADLMLRVIEGLYNARSKPKMTDIMGKWLFQAAFWLIGAKILKDKEVESFTRLKISNIESLIGKVQRHYGAADRLDVSKINQRKAMEKVAENIVEPVYSLSHITNESLAYVYENTLVTKATRKALGTHATPPWLVNYIVWQLVDWIEQIPENDRIILEPACGHAPFLTAGARLLSFLYEGSEEKRHDYLKSHLVGMEKDIFAQEIARLSLTLADIPHPDGWDIKNEDIYSADVLRELAEQSTILLCNPPFENFSEDEKVEYNDIETGNKAAEILERTLPYMQPDSVFGVVLPQGFLHKRNLGNLRKYILDNFEIRTICSLPDNVFTKAKHLSTILLGRKKKSKKNISYIWVSKSGLDTFAKSYQAEEESLAIEELYKAKCYSFRVPKLKEIWEYCKTYDCLSNVADTGQGLVFKGKGLPPNSITVSSEPFEGSVKGFNFYSKNVKITELPDEVYMNLSPDVIRRPQWGTIRRVQQILLNYARVGNEPWRLKAWIDKKGHPVTSNFIVMRPIKSSIWTLNSLWALANSPFANAFAYCNSMERNNTAGMIRSMPVPFVSQDLSRLEKLVEEYFALSKKQMPFALDGDDKWNVEKKKSLLKIDAEVLRLYDLPPRLERQLLDYFIEVQRKGVDFEFDRYYPEGFDSWIPLHEYLSEEYQRSTPSFVNEWVEKNRSPEVIRALKAAVEAFED